MVIGTIHANSDFYLGWFHGIMNGTMPIELPKEVNKEDFKLGFDTARETIRNPNDSQGYMLVGYALIKDLISSRNIYIDYE